MRQGKSKIRTVKGAEMSDYTYRKIITDRKGATIVIKEVNVPDEVVNQIRADVIDEFARKLIQTVTSMTTGFRVVDNIERIANELKEQDK